MSKRKIIAIILFVFLSLFMFTHAGPSKIEIKDKSNIDKIEEESVVEQNEEETINVDKEINKDTEEVSYKIVVDPDRVVILLGDDYDVMTGVKIEPNAKLEIKANINSTTELEVGSHLIVYTARDKNNNKIIANREIVVLDLESDLDQDGFTNEEELKDQTDPEDPESHPETEDPTIRLKGSNPYYMIVGTEYEEPGYEIIVDKHDKNTTEEDVEITGEVEEDEIGEYELTYKVTDMYGKSASATRTVKVLDGESDLDQDGFTNEEEIASGTDPEDESDIPDYQKNPTINIDSCITTMYVYDQIPNLNECVKVTDEFYGTEGVTFDIDASAIKYDKHGKYKVKVTAFDNLDNKTVKEFDFEVLKRAVIVKIDNKTSIYLDAIEEFTSNADSVAVAGTDIGVELSSTVTNTSDVGTYDINGTWTNDNYNVTFVTGTYTITPKKLTERDLGKVSFEDESFVYDKTEKKIEVTGLKEGFTVKYDDNTRVNVGRQNVVATISGTENYSGNVTLEAKLTVKPSKVTVTIDNKTKVYGTIDKDLTYIVTKGTVYGDDNLNITLTRESGESVGEYEITGVSANSNYDVTFINGTYTITKKNITSNDIIWSNLDFIYNGKEQKPTATIKGFGGMNIELEVNIKDNKKPINVGNYVAVAILPENYEIADVEKEKSFEIKPLRVNVDWEGSSFEYNGKEQKPTATYTDINKKQVDLVVTPNKESIDAGDYVATASGLEDNNYVLNESNLTHNYKITKKNISEKEIVWSDLEFTYNGKEQKPTATIKNTDIALDVSVNKFSKDVGVYTATVSSNNYEISGKTTTQFEIKAKKIAVEWKNTKLEFNGKEQKPTATVSTGITGETVELIVSGQAIKVGNYKATASMKILNPNYILTNEIVDFEITAITITSNDIIWSNLEFVYNGKEQKPTATIKGFAGMDIKLDINIKGNKESVNAGNYTAIASIPTDFIVEDGVNERDYVISPKQITAIWSNTVFEYDGDEHIPTATIDPSDIIGTDIVNITVSGKQTLVGTYKAVASISNSNYKLTNEEQNFTIKNVIEINGTSTPIAVGEGKSAEPGEKVKYEITLKPKTNGEVDFTTKPTYVIELDKNLVLDACPINATCSGNTITWTPQSINDKLTYTATVSKAAKAGDNLVTTIKENGQTISTINTKVEVTVSVAAKNSAPISKEIVLALDVSTSMQEKTDCDSNGKNCKSTRADDLIKASKAFVDDLLAKNITQSEINLTIITFGKLKIDFKDNYETLYSGLLTTDTINNVKSILGNTKNTDLIGGKTPLYEALGESYRVLNNSTRDKKYLVVLSDGAPNPSTDSNNIVSKLNSTDINIYSIGFGIDDITEEENVKAQEVLKKVAKNNPNHYFSATGELSLKAAFDTINEAIGEDLQTKNGKITVVKSYYDSKILISYKENNVEKSYTIANINDTAKLAEHNISIVDGNYVWNLSNYTNCTDFVIIVQ